MQVVLRNVSTMAFICVLMALQGCDCSYAGVSVIPDNAVRILIGDNKKTDWLEVRCVTHIEGLQSNVEPVKVINDYCDNTPIESVTFDGHAWVIVKHYSIWKFWQGETAEEDRLQLWGLIRKGGP